MSLPPLSFLSTLYHLAISSKLMALNIMFMESNSQIYIYVQTIFP